MKIENSNKKDFVNKIAKTPLNKLRQNTKPSSQTETYNDRSSGTERDNSDEYFLKARCKANEVYRELDELYKEYHQSLEYKRQWVDLIRRCFTAEGNGILYSIQQLGGCCFEGNLFHTETDRCRMARYWGNGILEQMEKINSNIFPQTTDIEGIISPEKKGTNKVILMNYLDTIHEGVILLKQELKSKPDALNQFYEKLWQETRFHLAALRDILAVGDENLCEQVKQWFEKTCSFLHQCGIEIVFYKDVSDKERENWFTVKSETQNIPAVIRTKSEVDEYIYFYGSWFQTEE